MFFYPLHLRHKRCRNNAWRKDVVVQLAELHSKVPINAMLKEILRCNAMILPGWTWALNTCQKKFHRPVIYRAHAVVWWFVREYFWIGIHWNWEVPWHCNLIPDDTNCSLIAIAIDFSRIVLGEHWCVTTSAIDTSTDVLWQKWVKLPDQILDYFNISSKRQTLLAQ